MRVIDAAALTCKTNGELIAMIRAAIESLQYMDVAGPEYAATVASIQVMRRVLAARQLRGPRF